MPLWHRATLTGRHPVTRGLFMLSLAVSPEVAATYQRPGQYHRLRQVEGGEAPFFAIGSAPGATTFEYLIRASTPLTTALEELPLGSAVEVSLPEGPGFPIESARGGAEVLLVGMGSAITPLRAMVQALSSHHRDGHTTTLVWGVRHETELSFEADREQWARDGVRLHLVLSRPSNGWSGLRGRVQDHLAPLVSSRTVAFICGHEEMEREVTHRLVAAGVLRERVFLNHPLR